LSKHCDHHKQTNWGQNAKTDQNYRTKIPSILRQLTLESIDLLFDVGVIARDPSVMLQALSAGGGV
jgi:hypothetical protein